MSPRRAATAAGPVRRALALALGAVLLSCSIACLTFLEASHNRAATTHPSPTSKESSSDEDEFPDVDWDYWLEINPDIIGWVTVPGTAVDYPIVQAPPDDPQFYLWHDVYGTWNFMGCPYLDADCANTGLLGSRNAVISGHNLGRGDMTMFAAFANYTDEVFAPDHALILLQTPSDKVELKVCAATRLQGGEPAKRTGFENYADYHCWLETCAMNASILLDTNFVTKEAVFSFVTCSYGLWDNERTVVLAYQDKAW